MATPTKPSKTAPARLKKLVLNAQPQQGLLITPRLDSYLLSHTDGFAFPPKIAEVGKALLSDTPRNRVASFSASARGRCIREQVYQYIGAPGVSTFDQQTINIFRDGHVRHLRWQLTLLHAGILSNIEVKVNRPEIPLLGSLDGVGSIPLNHPLYDASKRRVEFGWELKGVNNYTWRTAVQYGKGPLEQHLLQVHSYMWATGLEVFSIVYEHKETNDWREWVITRDDKIMQLVRMELTALQNAASKKKLPPQLHACEKQEGPFARCPYKDVCHKNAKEGTTWVKVAVPARSSKSSGQPSKVKVRVKVPQSYKERKQQTETAKEAAAAKRRVATKVPKPKRQPKPRP